MGSFFFRVFTSSPLTGARSSHVSSPVDKDLIASAHLRRWLNSGKQRSETGWLNYQVFLTSATSLNGNFTAKIALPLLKEVLKLN